MSKVLATPLSSSKAKLQFKKCILEIFSICYKSWLWTAICLL